MEQKHRTRVPQRRNNSPETSKSQREAPGRTETQMDPDCASMQDEILHRAAAGDGAALDILIEMALPLIRKRCPPTLRSHIDDIQQTVAWRLVRRFRNTQRPFHASSFFAFRSFLNQVTLNVAIDTWRSESQSQSLDALSASTGYEPTGPSGAEQVDAQMCLDRCLELLPHPLVREVFRLRFVLNASVGETLAILHARGEQVTRQDVYRMAERSIAQLSKLPEVRDMFEAREH